MSDRRATPANGRVAAKWLKGQVTADRFVDGDVQRVVLPCADLRDAPDGARDRQVQFGEAVTVFENRGGWGFVRRECDGYVGYLSSDALGPAKTATHFVATPATHLYAAPDFKSPDLMRLGFFARVTVTSELKNHFETPEGFIPKKHLRPLDRPFTDPATVAQTHFGVPYLWGGNSTMGIDCSGLVQVALLACGIACPGDSDMQEAAVGAALAPDAPLERGDLLFWKGHVAMGVDPETLIHANAHHMAVVYEPAQAAISRIKAQGDGGVTSRRRL